MQVVGPVGGQLPWLVRAEGDAEPREGILPWLEEIEPDEAKGSGAAHKAAVPSTSWRAASGVIGIGALLGAALVYSVTQNPQNGSPDRNVLKSDARGEPVLADDSSARVAAAAPDRNHPAAADTPTGLSMHDVAGGEVPRNPGRILHPAPERATRASRTASAQQRESGKLRNETPTGDSQQPETVPATSARSFSEAASRPGGSTDCSTVGQAIQLAALPSGQTAAADWERLMRRRPQLAQLCHKIIPATVESRQFFRLRAYGPNAHMICDRMSRSGIDCMKIGR